MRSVTSVLRGSCWLLALLSTVHIGMGSRNPQIHDLSGIAVVRDVTFGSTGGEILALDLYLPTASFQAPRPLAIAVHGGSWTGGSRRDYGPQFAGLVREGVVVAVIDYRLARPGAPSWDGALDDVRSALTAVVRRAGEFGIDIRRTATIGTSAGGLLAARAAQIDPRIRAAVCLSSPTSLTDLVAARKLRHDPVEIFLGTDAKAALSASPLDHVGRNNPAMMLIHGDADRWVPGNQARKMHETLEEASVFSRLVVIPGARHGFELHVGSPEPRDLTPEILEFLNESWNAHAASHADSPR